MVVALCSVAFVLKAARGQELPQEAAIAKGPRPYTNQEVSFSDSRGSVKLAGTLSVPIGRGPFPAVLLIAAAGPEGRDENANGHLVFVVLADYLLRRGVAVLRYDKRGVGASTGSFDTATFGDLVSDATEGFRYLRLRPEADPHRVGVIGHSEGGSIGPAVAVADKDVAFIVAMAGSGLSGEFRITEHWAYVAEEGGASPEQLVKIRAMSQQIFRTAALTPDDAVASRRIAALVDATVAAKALKQGEATDIKQLMTPKFVRMELNDNPLSYLKKVSVPVLALVGSLDRTVPPAPYAEAMRPVLEAIPGSKLQVLPGLNHLMQGVHSDESISPLALNAIGHWVAEQVRRPGN